MESIYDILFIINNNQEKYNLEIPSNENIYDTSEEISLNKTKEKENENNRIACLDKIIYQN